MQTVTSQPVLDAIAQALLPQILQALRSGSSTTTTDVKPVDSLVVESVHVQTSPSVSHDSSIEASEEQPEEKVEPLDASDEREEEEEEEVEDKEDTVRDSKSVEEVPEESEENEEYKDPEPLVIDRPPKANSALRSLLSLFKISPKNRRIEEEPNENVEEEEVEIPNLEDSLKQLADMGFSDRESNIKLLRFHKKYNEGVDEVIEDLLMQMQEKLKLQTSMTEEVRN
jgi:hypothetical protein